ncbi:tRNA-dihydrouridine synthase family protein [bacterium]|nr:tRNA-dihydrouridine synthase family protein [candidate division CSSED10-310 bacterium]
MNTIFTERLRGGIMLGSLSKLGNLPFRRLCVACGAQGTIGEMAMAHKLLDETSPEYALLRRHPSETFFGIQLVGGKPETMAEAARKAAATGPDFIDLNMACPIEQVTSRGGGAQLLRKTGKARRIITAVRSAVTIPLTVKIRSGWTREHPNAVEMARIAAGEGADAVMLHARSRCQRYRGPADWDIVARVVEAVSIPVVGSGDLFHHFEVTSRMRESGCSAVIIGRGALIKPWIFKEIIGGAILDPTAEERMTLLRKLAVFTVEHFGDDEFGLRRARRFLADQLDFLTRYLPSGLLEEPQRLQHRGQPVEFRSPLEALLGDRGRCDELLEHMLDDIPAAQHTFPA